MSTKVANIGLMYDDRYGHPGLFNYAQCKQCGSVYNMDGLSEADKEDLYNKYYPAPPLKKPITHFFTGLLRTLYVIMTRGPELALHVRPGSTVLDVGCAYGGSYFPVTIKKSSWTGLDPDARKIATLTRIGRQAYCGFLEHYARTATERYDCILASQIIEHCEVPDDFFTACYDLLNDSGHLILSTPNCDSRFRKTHGTSWINYHVPYHQTLFTKRGLEILAHRHSMRIVRCTELTPALWFVHQKKYVCPKRGTRGQWYTQRPDSLSVFAASFLTRLSDALYKNGDCLLAIIEKRALHH